jgi:hypothetical protein
LTAADMGWQQLLLEYELLPPPLDQGNPETAGGPPPSRAPVVRERIPKKRGRGPKEADGGGGVPHKRRRWWVTRGRCVCMYLPSFPPGFQEVHHSQSTAGLMKNQTSWIPRRGSRGRRRGCGCIMEAPGP